MSSIDDSIGKVYGNNKTGSKRAEAVGEPDKAEKADNDGARKRRKNKQALELSPEKSKRHHITYKYSHRGTNILREAVIIGGLPFFLEYNKGEINVVEKIEEAVRVLKPPYLEEYPYEAYEFANIKEIKNLVKEAESISIDSLYIRCKELVQEYNDQDPNKLVLIAADILFSYFQDKFATTHYISIVGDNDSGKSSIGITFESVGYRPVYMTDPSAANIFRCIGGIEPGQCTIILDEADKIDKSPEMMAMNELLINSISSYS